MKSEYVSLHIWKRKKYKKKHFQFKQIQIL